MKPFAATLRRLIDVQPSRASLSGRYWRSAPLPCPPMGDLIRETEARPGETAEQGMARLIDEMREDLRTLEEP